MKGTPIWQGLLRADTRAPTWYAVSSLVYGLVGTVVTVFGLIYSVAFAVFGIGLLLFSLLTTACDRLLLVESERAQRLLGVAVHCPPLPGDTGGNPFRRAIVMATRLRTYRRLLAVLLGGVTGLFTALVALGCWYLVVRGLLELSFVVVWPEGLDHAWGGSRLGALIVHTLPGVIAWLAGPFLIRQAGHARAQLVRSLVEEPRTTPTAHSPHQALPQKPSPTTGE
jgi:hypothetical protein